MIDKWAFRTAVLCVFFTFCVIVCVGLMVLLSVAIFKNLLVAVLVDLGLTLFILGLIVYIGEKNLKY